MRCRSARILITQQLRETPAPEASAALSRHLARCSRCRAEQIALRALAARLAAGQCAPVPLPVPVVARGWTERLLQSPPRRAAVRPSLPGWPQLAPFATAGLLLALLIAHTLLPTHQHPGAARGSRSASRGTSELPVRAREGGAGSKFSDAKTRTGEPRLGAPRLWRWPGPGRVREGNPAFRSPRFLAASRNPSGSPADPHARGYSSESAPSPLSHFGADNDRAGRPDDLAALNADPLQQDQRWSSLPTDEWQKIEARVRAVVRVRDDFVTIPFPRLASTSNRQIAEAVESYKREAAIVDPRLAREVDCASKGTALSDLCPQLSSDTGIELTAGPSVADEKVTLFCEKMPLREVMRQLARPFGYTWLRSGTPGQYRYELEQDLRSQLLEEELRNRARDAALLDLDQEMGQYRPYLNLTPDEALARAASAPPEEKKLLEYLAGKGWGPAQLYFRLTPADVAALRAGQKLSFNAAGRPLPPEMARDVMTSLRDYRVVRHGDNFEAAIAKELPDGIPPASVPEARPMVSLSLDRSELGQLTLHGLSGFYIGTPPNCLQLMGDDDRDLAVGVSPAIRSPQNAVANARLTRDPALQGHVTVEPGAWRLAPGASPNAAQSKIQNPKSQMVKLTSADVLEAIHRATGLPIVADYYTRLYPAAQVAVQNVRLFEALNRLSDRMRLRWSKDRDQGAGSWLQFRSADFYDDRLKEVPNRLLVRWAASRREHGALTLDDLIEISQLTDAQLDSSTMAEGARELYGLEEWDLARRSELRPHWRFLAHLTPAQRQAAQSAAGLPLTRLSLAQQQEFLSLLPSQVDQSRSLLDLGEASLQIDYTVPGEFQWRPTAAETASTRRPPAGPPPVRERTRQAALAAAQRIDPQATAAQITPTELSLTLTYRLGGDGTRLTPFVMYAGLHSLLATLPQPVTH